jgi:hypothetical protein
MKTKRNAPTRFLRTMFFASALVAASAQIAKADGVEWTMSLSPASTTAHSGDTIDFLITFTNALTQDISFSDFGDGQSITVDLSGNVIGSGACNPGEDCFTQNLFITSDDPIDILAGSTGTTFDLGELFLGTHAVGDVITVTAKGGPDSLPTGAFPDPAFQETSAIVTIVGVPVPEPTPMILCLLGAGWSVISRRLWRR